MSDPVPRHSKLWKLEWRPRLVELTFERAKASDHDNVIKTGSLGAEPEARIWIHVTYREEDTREKPMQESGKQDEEAKS